MHERFGSLDVVNLYGSIPLVGEGNVYDVVSAYFDSNRHQTVFDAMTGADFVELLHLALDSDYINIDGSIYRQKNGVAMGNNLSPTVAIIYMDYIEQQVLEKTSTRIWTRFIDDIFLSQGKIMRNC